jgi:diguanylate cyclase (GGDEF)-like protein/PAS domain S-box-containing protein
MLTERDSDLFSAKLIEQLSIATFVVDRFCRVLVWNKACERLTGVPAAEVVGSSNHWKALHDELKRPSLSQLMVRGQLDKAKALYEVWSDSDVNPKGISTETWCVLPHIGKRRYLAVDAAPIYDDDGELIAVVETLRDLTAHNQMTTELRELAGRDSLTSIANRRTFDQKLDDEWRRAIRHGTPLSLLIIDVDFFKQYNDAYGHQKGDECLKMIARCIKSHAPRAGDLAARLGGEEFAVILPQTTNEGAVVAAERIRQAVLNEMIAHAGSMVSPHVTVSVGVMTSGAETDILDFVTKADVALYEAKRSGRNRIANFVSSDELISHRNCA